MSKKEEMENTLDGSVIEGKDEVEIDIEVIKDLHKIFANDNGYVEREKE